MNSAQVSIVHKSTLKYSIYYLQLPSIWIENVTFHLQLFWLLSWMDFLWTKHIFNFCFYFPNMLITSDLDECAAPAAPCTHLCTNTDGSYYCLCRNGFRMDGKSTCLVTGIQTWDSHLFIAVILLSSKIKPIIKQTKGHKSVNWLWWQKSSYKNQRWHVVPVTLKFSWKI